jgi:hypothetical protein
MTSDWSGPVGIGFFFMGLGFWFAGLGVFFFLGAKAKVVKAEATKAGLLKS